MKKLIYSQEDLDLVLSLETEEKDKEIERLNENNQAYQKELCKVWVERDNAYRIINELEKWLEEDLKEVYRDAGYRHNLILEVLDKLHELKGDGSNGR